MSLAANTASGRVGREQFAAGAVAGSLVEIAGEHPCFGVRQSFGERVAVAAQAFAGVEVVFGAGDECNAAIADRDQLRGHRARAAIVVDADGEVRVTVRQRVFISTRAASGQVLVRKSVLPTKGDITSRPSTRRALHAVRRPVLRMAVVARHSSAARGRAPPVDAAHEFREEFTVQVGHTTPMVCVRRLLKDRAAWCGL